MKLGTVFILLVLSIVGCGEKNTPKNDSASLQVPVALLQSDLQALNTIDTTGFEEFDQTHYRLLSKIFGGLNPENFTSFLDARLKYFFAENDPDVDVTPRSVMEQSWMRDNGKTLQRVVRGAANIGTQFWLAALVAQTPVTFIFHGTRIPISSSRAGIMLIGEGYVSETENDIGKKVKLPVAYRHSMLFHEARHSDCTGGISQSDISVIRTSRNVREFAARNTAKSCGHLHVYCPRGHQFEGYAACDGTEWGSYAIGAIYAKAIANNPKQSNLDFNIMKATAIDSESRLLIQLGTNPDLSSSGVRD